MFCKKSLYFFIDDSPGTSKWFHCIMYSFAGSPLVSSLYILVSSREAQYSRGCSLCTSRRPKMPVIGGENASADICQGYHLDYSVEEHLLLLILLSIGLIAGLSLLYVCFLKWVAQVKFSVTVSEL